MKPLIWTDPAASQLESELAYVEAASPRVLASVLATEEVLRLFPKAGRLLSRYGVRKFAVPGTGLILIYRDAPTEVRVIACFHGRQNWTKLISSLPK